MGRNSYLNGVRNGFVNGLRVESINTEVLGRMSVGRCGYV